MRASLADILAAERFLAARNDALPLAVLVPIDMDDLRRREPLPQPRQTKGCAVKLQKHLAAALERSLDQIIEVKIEVLGPILGGEVQVFHRPLGTEQFADAVEALIFLEVVVNEVVMLVNPQRPNQILS